MKHWALPWLATLTTLPMHARAEIPSWPLETLSGRAFGWGHGGVGDLDGDGIDDQVSLSYPRVDIWLGRGRTIPDVNAPADWAELYSPPDDVGTLTLVPAGDVDGDGHADFAVGVGSDDPTRDFVDYVIVRHGADRPTIISPTPWVIGARGPGTGFGSAMAAGDVNGDGFSDLLISAPGDSSDPLAIARVTLHLGSPIGLEAREAWVAEGPVGFGSAVAILDFDGDGLADVLVAGPLGVELFRGQRRESDFDLDFAPLSTSSRVLVTTPGVEAEALTSLGDFDGDGFADALLVDVGRNHLDLLLGGAFPGTGHVLPLALSERELMLDGLVHPAAFAGINVVAAGDLDGDGRADIAFTALNPPFDRTVTPGVYLLFGRPDRDLDPVRVDARDGSELIALGDYDGDGYADLRLDHTTVVFGRATTVGPAQSVAPSEVVAAGAQPIAIDDVVCVGDVDGDGFDDLMLTSRGEPAGGCVGCARATLLRGNPVGLVPASDERGRPGDVAREILAPGDIDDDGYADVITTSESAPHNGAMNAGRAQLYWGSATGLQTSTIDKSAWEMFGNGDEARLGHAPSAAGDINGDGRMEVLLDTRANLSGPDVVLLGFDGRELRTAFTWPADTSLPSGVRREYAAGLGDLDGDGRADLGLVKHGAAHGLPQVLQLMHGRPNGPSEVLLLDLGPTLLEVLHPVGDLDGDGLGDLAAYSGGQIGSPRVVAHVVYGARALLRAGMETHVVTDDATFPDVAHAELPRLFRAGDLDGDGLGDLAVLVATQGPENQGYLAVFRGTSKGAELTYSREGTYVERDLSLAGTGGCDLDGDRFADLAIKTIPIPLQAGLGIHYGNGALGHRSAFPYAAFAVQPDVPDAATPISPGGRSRSATSFAVRALGRSPYGPARVRLEVEVKSFDRAFDGLSLVTGDYAAAGRNTSVPVETVIRGLKPDTAYHWRARIGYDRTQAPLTSHSRWFGGPFVPVPSRVDVRTRANAAPIPTDDVVFANEGVAISVAPGVLGNDEDPDGDPLTASQVTAPQHGQLLFFAENGSFSYRAEEGYAGVDHFTYAVTDGLSAPVRATVTIATERCDRCGRGDYYVAVHTVSGALRSIHCWTEDDGEPRCATDASGTLVLGDPVCGP